MVETPITLMEGEPVGVDSALEDDSTIVDPGAAVTDAEAVAEVEAVERVMVVPDEVAEVAVEVAAEVERVITVAEAVEEAVEVLSDSRAEVEEERLCEAVEEEDVSRPDELVLVAVMTGEEVELELLEVVLIDEAALVLEDPSVLVYDIVAVVI
jgi:hypothetical protein